jgi:hypothetical protein
LSLEAFAASTDKAARKERERKVLSTLVYARDNVDKMKETPVLQALL